MTYDEVVDHFGTAYRVAEQVGLSVGTAYYWKKLGYIPICTQMRLEQFTQGKLKANLDHCKRNDDVKRKREG